MSMHSPQTRFLQACLLLASLALTGCATNAHKIRFASPSDRDVTIAYGQPYKGGPSNGICYAVQVGDPIRASAEGEVQFARRVGFVGEIIILKHEPPMRTIYTGSMTMNVGEGARVTKGQIIATIAEPPADRDREFCFEIRKDIDPIDPQQWLAK